MDRQKDFNDFSELSYGNKNFASFFKSKEHLSGKLASAFDEIRQNAWKEAKGDLPFKVYIGEDITEIYTPNSSMAIVYKYDERGAVTSITGAMSSLTPEVSSDFYRFALEQGAEPDKFTVSYSQLSYYPNGQTKVVAGVENHGEQGFESGIKSAYLRSKSIAGEILKASSAYEYVNENGQDCVEAITAKNVEKLSVEPSDVVGFRLDILSQNPQGNYFVDGAPANGSQIIEIMSKVQADMQQYTSQMASSNAASLEA